MLNRSRDAALSPLPRPASRPELKAKRLRNLFGRASERASPNCSAAQLRRDDDAAFPVFLKNFRAHLELSGDRH